MDEETLVAHSLEFHQKTVVGFCDVCGITFFSQSGLWKHRKVHKGDKVGAPKCHVCGKFFSSVSYLNSHMRRHTNEKPFFCETCGKAYKYQSDWRSHLCPINTNRTGEVTFVPH